MYFEETELNDNILDALYDMRFEECTPIQEATIKPILQGHDIMGVAQTGTGKTAAYLLPVLSLLDDGLDAHDKAFPEDSINCLIMSPTRELAQQIDQAMQGFGYYLNGISSVAVYGGNDGNRYDQELHSLREGASVIIATPGRLISHIQMGNVDLSRLSFFILDEADRMLDMGFSEDILSIAKLLPASCQTIMFSATMPEKIEALANKLLKNPVQVKIAVSKPAEKIQQSAFVCYPSQKNGIIRSIFKAGDLKRVIIFSGKKQRVKEINRALRQMKVNCGEMHSDLSQAERDDIMFRFKSGEIDVLVATDIVARGIDIDDIHMVINYDVPHDVEDYVHRIGRTARADRDGIAYTLVSDDEIYLFKNIEKFLESEITKNPIPEGLGEAPEYKVVHTMKGKPTRSKTTHKTSRNSKTKNNQNENHKNRTKKNNHKSLQKKKPDPVLRKDKEDSSEQKSLTTGNKRPKTNRKKTTKPAVKDVSPKD